MDWQRRERLLVSNTDSSSRWRAADPLGLAGVNVYKRRPPQTDIQLYKSTAERRASAECWGGVSVIAVVKSEQTGWWTQRRILPEKQNITVTVADRLLLLLIKWLLNTLWLFWVSKVLCPLSSVLLRLCLSCEFICLCALDTHSFQTTFHQQKAFLCWGGLWWIISLWMLLTVTSDMQQYHLVQLH